LQENTVFQYKLLYVCISNLPPNFNAWDFLLAAFQLGLLEGEINDLLRGIHGVRTPQPETSDENVEEDGSIAQREIGSEDVCSICQEMLLEKMLPVTFCR
jgi:hypothetical protein